MQEKRIFADLAYGSDHPRHRLDVMLPEGNSPFPVVVAVHGGAWRGGDKQSMLPYGRLFAEAGMATVMPNYRLTTTHPHPAQEEDIISVLDWIGARAAAYELDSGRVGFTGSSAGGHLSAQVGLKATRVHHPCRIRCMVPVSGIFDFATWVREMPHARGEVEPLLGGRVEQKPELLREISPLTHVHRNAPACMALHGEADDDVPCSQTLQFVAALGGAGCDATARIVPGLGHVAFQRRGDGMLEPLGGLSKFISFFEKHLLQ